MVFLAREMEEAHSEKMGLLSHYYTDRKYFCPKCVRQNKGFLILCCTAFTILTVGVIFIIVRVPEIEPNIKSDVLLSELIAKGVTYQALGRVNVSLDSPAQDRWELLGRRFSHYSNHITQIARLLGNSSLNADLHLDNLSMENHIRNYSDPSFLVEIKSYAKALNVSYEDLLLYNLYYIYNTYCKVELVQEHLGRIWQKVFLAYEHPVLTHKLSLEIDFLLHGKLVFRAITSVGLVGVPAGVKPHMFAITLKNNPVPEYKEGCISMDYNWLHSLFTIRKILTISTSYESAEMMLNAHKFGSNIIMSGVKDGQAMMKEKPCSSQATSTLDITKMNPFYTLMMSASTPDHFESLRWVKPDSIASLRSANEQFLHDQLTPSRVS